MKFKEEVQTMLNLDLSKSVAMRQMQEMAQAEGWAEGWAEGRAEARLEVTRQLLIETLQERFSRVPKTVGTRLHRIQQPEVLKTLFRQALQCQNLKQFQEILVQVE
jgi:predicted transposase YdaD